MVGDGTTNNICLLGLILRSLAVQSEAQELVARKGGSDRENRLQALS